MISENEFGRVFEVGMLARANNKERDSHNYLNEIRIMAFRDGWDSANSAILNPSIPDSAESIIEQLQTEQKGNLINAKR